tara:strand:- start:5999 stop:6997 length:999 start_codon:yes stop_codon:yes gene_type:complete
MATWKQVPLAEATDGTNADMVMAPADTIDPVVLLDNWVSTLLPVQFDGEQPAVFSVQLNIPAAITPEGCVFECGGNIRGVMLCFDGNGDLVFRFHDSREGRRVVIANSLLPRDETVTIVAEVTHLGGATVVADESRFPSRPLDRTRVWVNQTLRGYAEGERSTDSVWAQFVGGKVDGTGIFHVGDKFPNKEVGNYDQDLSTSGVIWVSDLRYYRNAIVETPAKNIDTINVIQENHTIRSSVATYEGSRRVPWLNTGKARIDWSESALIDQVAWDHNRITDIKFEDDEEGQVVYDHNRESSVLQAEEETVSATWLNSKTCPVTWLNSKESKVY